MVPGSCASLVWVSCFVVLRTWVFPLALLILGLRFTLQSKLLDENVCACELEWALHFSMPPTIDCSPAPGNFPGGL